MRGVIATKTDGGSATATRHHTLLQTYYHSRHLAFLYTKLLAAAEINCRCDGVNE